ncbi:MAG: lspA [Verrucomicrobiales bacterium]|nr:lspA [Verrucomicrobiales bacterium]
MNWTPNRRMAAIAIVIFALDQLTKFLALQYLGPVQGGVSREHVVLDGFFKLVLWGNTGAAWSLFHDSNEALAIVSLIALLALFIWRNKFDTTTWLGQLSLGLIFGGIIGNLFDRLDPHRAQVIDFLRFYLRKRSGEEVGFPAFNIADSAICVGVGLLIILSWKRDAETKNAHIAGAAQQ